MPKGREQYCPEVHYRPCPICGTPVIAKYLSDPPRKCDKCKGRKSATVSTEVKKPESKQEHPKQKSIFKLDTKGFTMNTMKPVAPMSPMTIKEFKQEKPKEEVVETLQPNRIPQRRENIPATIDQSVFCETTSGTVNKYIGNQYPNCFIPGHEYLLKIERREYAYWITSEEDVTAGETVNIVLPLSSQISFHQNFIRAKVASN